MRVVHVWAGPRRSSALKAVTSFITDAGFIGAVALIASAGVAWSTGRVQRLTASAGMRALSSARRTPGGRPATPAWVIGASSRPAMNSAQREGFFMGSTGILIECRRARR